MTQSLTVHTLEEASTDLSRHSDARNTVGMTYILNLNTGASVYIDPLLAQRLSGRKDNFEFRRFRQRLCNEHEAALNAHVAQLRGLDTNEAAHLVVAVPQDDTPPVWLHFCSRIMTRASPAEIVVVGAAVELSDDEATALQRDIARQILDAEEGERRRIGRELHDSTVQHLVGLGLILARLRSSSAPSSAMALDEMQNLLEAVQNEMRSFVFLLHPPAVKELGLEHSLRLLAHGFQRRTELELLTETRLDDASLSFDAEIALFRVAQEALMNVHRHARATRVKLELSNDAACVTLRITDDGIGMKPCSMEEALRKGGVGLSGMRARVLQLGGAFRLTNSDQGLRIEASVPHNMHRDQPS